MNVNIIPIVPLLPNLVLTDVLLTIPAASALHATLARRWLTRLTALTERKLVQTAVVVRELVVNQTRG